MTVAAILARKGRDVLTVRKETPIADVVRLLGERRIGAIDRFGETGAGRTRHGG